MSQDNPNVTGYRGMGNHLQFTHLSLDLKLEVQYFSAARELAHAILTHVCKNNHHL